MVRRGIAMAFKISTRGAPLAGLAAIVILTAAFIGTLDNYMAPLAGTGCIVLLVLVPGALLGALYGIRRGRTVGLYSCIASWISADVCIAAAGYRRGVFAFLPFTYDFCLLIWLVPSVIVGCLLGVAIPAL